MLQFNFTPFPILETKRLQLCRMTEADINEILLLRTDKEITKYLDRDPPKSIAEVIEWLKQVDESINQNKGISWGIYLKDNTKLIGTIGLWRTIPEHHRAEIGYSLLPHHWRKGIMLEAMTASLQYGFNEMKLHSIEANVNPFNKASIGILEKINFEKEAHFKEDYFYDGKFSDSAIYSLLERNFKVL